MPAFACMHSLTDVLHLTRSLGTSRLKCRCAGCRQQAKPVLVCHASRGLPYFISWADLSDLLKAQHDFTEPVHCGLGTAQTEGQGTDLTHEFRLGSV